MGQLPGFVHSDPDGGLVVVRNVLPGGESLLPHLKAEKHEESTLSHEANCHDQPI